MQPDGEGRSRPVILGEIVRDFLQAHPDEGIRPSTGVERLPQSFRQEQNDLDKAGINSWKPCETSIAASRLGATPLVPRNLNRLRGIATLVCELDLAPQDAALLMHAGIASRRALADCTPEQLVRQTGRLQRSLGINRPGSVDLPVAKAWIHKARQLRN